MKHFTVVPKSLEKLEKDKALDVGLVTLMPTGTGNVQMDVSESGTLKLSGSGTTRPWFRHTVTVNGGGVSAIGFDWTNGGHDGMYKSVLMHDGVTTEKIWPGPTKGFLGYIDTKGRGITGFSFGSTGRCNFTGATVENICLSNLMPLPGTDTVPASWAAFTLRSADTWDAMIEANHEQEWQRELEAKESLPAELRDFIAANSDSVRFITGLRRVMLMRALLERFPAEVARHPEAHKSLSRTTREIVVPWWPDSQTSPFGILHEYPRHFELATRWESLIGEPALGSPKHSLHPKDVQGLLNIPPQNGVFLLASPSHAISYHTALDRILMNLPAEQLAPLREDQDRAVSYLVEKLLRERDVDAAVRLARRAPLARCVHELLLEIAESELREGRRQWALACFGDVLRHAAEPDLLAQARVGRWLALAQDEDDRDALLAEVSAMPGDAAVPWRGARARADEVRRQLLTADARSAPTCKTLPQTLIRLPAAWPAERRCSDGPQADLGLRAPWPVSQVQGVGPSLFVFAPGHAAKFRLLDGGGPAWVAEMPAADAGQVVASNATPPRAAAGPQVEFAPAADESRFTAAVRRPVTVRSGSSSAISDDNRTCFTFVPSARPEVMAIDASTGGIRWSTVSRDDLKGLVPMSRPTAADGRVFFLAVPAGLPPTIGLGAARDAGKPVVWRIVCLDGADGALLWEQILGWQPYTLIDVARGTAGISVHDGGLYAATNMGIVARCDIRDGAVDWVRGYASMANTDPGSDTYGREGAAPLVVGDRVLVAPRDHSGVLAFARDTGGILWEAIAVPSDKLVGVSGRIVVGVSDRRVCGIDVTTGRPVWSRTFAEGTASRATLLGEDVLVVTGATLQRFSAATGEIRETVAPVGTPDTVIVLTGGGRVIELMSPQPAG